MRTLYFDCFAGASGDMILGALVAAGADARALREQLALLDVSGFEVGFETVDRSGISATHARVRTVEEKQHLVPFLRVGRPINRKQGCDPHTKAQFLSHLADTCL